MSEWRDITDDPPHSREVVLWLRAPEGASRPIGPVIANYIEGDFFIGWCEKSVSGNINTGLRQDIITHWKELDAGPE